MGDRCRSDGFVRILGFFPVFKEPGFSHAVFRAIGFPDKSQRFLGRLVGYACGIRTHVCDEPHGFAAFELDAFVKLLRQHHGLLG